MRVSRQQPRRGRGRDKGCGASAVHWPRQQDNRRRDGQPPCPETNTAHLNYGTLETTLFTPLLPMYTALRACGGYPGSRFRPTSPAPPHLPASWTQPARACRSSVARRRRSATRPTARLAAATGTKSRLHARSTARATCSPCSLVRSAQSRCGARRHSLSPYFKTHTRLSYHYSNTCSVDYILGQVLLATQLLK